MSGMIRKRVAPNSAALAVAVALIAGFAAPADALVPETAGFKPTTVIAAAPATEAGSEILHKTVRSLIHAISANRAADAYAIASPSVRANFGDPSLFLAMIARFQAPLYKAQKFQFDGIDRSGDQPVVRAFLEAGKYRRWLARFTMEPQADGSWTIRDVALKRAPGHVI